MIGLMVVMLMIFFSCGELVLVQVLWGVGELTKLCCTVAGK